MSVDDIVKLFDAVTKLLNVLIWPGVLLFILIRFAQDLREFFSSLGELSLKGAGFEASLKRKQAEVVAALSAAAAARPDEDKTRDSVAASVIVSATFGHLQDSSPELNTLKSCPIWITPC